MFISFDRTPELPIENLSKIVENRRKSSQFVTIGTPDSIFFRATRSVVVLPPPGRAARFFISPFVATALSYGHPGRPVVPELSRSSKNRDFRCDQDFRRSKQQLTVSIDAPRARKSQNVRTGRTSCATTIAGGQSDTFRSQFEPPRTRMQKNNPQIRDTAFSCLLETFASTGRPGTPYERCRDKP